jgi:hypothetical protein
MMIQQTAQIPASRQLEVLLPDTFTPGTKVVYTISIMKVQDNPDALPDKHSPEDAFGLWKGRAVTLESIRAKAWGTNNVSL